MTSSIATILNDNLQRLRGRIDAACERVGRDPHGVTLVAVTKYADLDWVKALVDLGVTDLGESRPQQLVARASQLPGHLRWHLIGHLQRNKVDLVLPAVTRIHSVDSVRLIEALHKELLKQIAGTKDSTDSRRPGILLEVNVSGEASKDGFDPKDLLAAWPGILQWDAVRIDGLMTMAPHEDSDDVSRRVFRSLRAVRDQLVQATERRLPLPELSMGMSGDFEIGIEEGATLVRIGSSLFEGLVSREAPGG